MARKINKAWRLTQPTVPTGVELLDHLMDCGVQKGHLTYLVGTPGTGRAVMGAQFLLATERATWLGIDDLEPNLPPEMLGLMESAEANGNLSLLAISSLDSQTEVELAEQLTKLQPERAVIWGADILEMNNAAFLAALLRVLRSAEITSLAIGTSGSFGTELQVLTPRLLSYADNVILTQIRLEMDETVLLARALKTTPPQTNPPTVQYRYERDKIVITEALTSASAQRPVSRRKRFTIVPELFHLNTRHQELVRTQLDHVNKDYAHSEFVTHGPPFANVVQYNTQLEEVKAGRQRWDLFIVDICRLREMVDCGLIQPLDAFLPTGWEDRYLKVAVDQCRVNGQTWALPHWINIGILVFRQDLLSKYKLQVPTNWYDLVECASRVMKGEKQDGISGFAFQGAQVEALTCNFLEFLWGNGGSVYDASLHINLAAQEAVGALEFMCDLIYKHKIAPAQMPTYTEAHSQRMFLEHRLLFTRSWPKFLKELPQTYAAPEEKVSISHLPTFSADIRPRGVIGGFCYVIGRHVTNPEVLIDFHSTFYSDKMVERIAREGSMCSPFRSAYEDPYLLARHSSLPGIPQLLETGLSRGAIPHYAKLTEVIQREVNLALRKIKSPREALETAAEDLHKDIFRHHREQRLAHAIEYVEQSLHDEICRDKAAQACHLAPSYFSALFSDVFGCSFTRYVSEKRIEKAKDLLEQSGLTIAQVGQAVGIKDQSYFCQVFRQCTHMTPTEYRVNAMTNASHH